MPNWCMNTASISGNVEKLKEIVNAAQEEKLLEYLVPIGEWDYDTAVETWGTKWDATNISWDLDEANSTLELSFDTAWGPPITAYFHAMEEHPLKINAYYYEPGMQFCGYVDEHGNSHWDIDFKDAQYRYDIPKDIIDHWGLDYEYESWKEYQDDEIED